jgi:hypothetical protein
MLVTLFAGALLTVACSSSDAATDVDTNQTYDGRSVGEAFCARMERCSLDTLKQEYGDVAKCNEVEGAAEDKDLSAPGATNDSGTIGACVEALNGGACGTSTSACDFRGSKPVGAACGTSEQCASGYCKHGVDPATQDENVCGKCYPTVGSGGDCTNAACSADHETCVANKCTRLPGKGQACDPNNLPCLSPLACVANQCVDRLAAGAACTAGATPCQSGLSCIAGKCTAPTVTYARTGQACNVDTTSPTRVKCLAGECVKGTCVGLATQLGQACDPDVGCVGSYVCRNAKCVLDDPSACK